MIAGVPAAAEPFATRGWYLVRTSSGNVGFVNHSTHGLINLGDGQTLSQAIYLGPNQGGLDPSIATLGAKLQQALAQLRATPYQAQDLVAQIDAGSGKNNSLNQLLISPAGKPVQGVTSGGAAVPTNLTGDAAAAGVTLPSGIPGALSGIWQSAVGDAKYAAVLIAALLIGAVLMFHGVSGGGHVSQVVPVPV